MQATADELGEFFGTVLPHLNEVQRRVVVGSMARVLGHGGKTRVAEASGMSRSTAIKAVSEWTITGIHNDQSITLTGRTGTVQRPAEYVTEHLELGYAQTSHATQGRTVDTALLLLDTPTDSRGVYTPMTRGREANHAYVVTEENQTPHDMLTQALSQDWIDQPAIARRDQLDPHRQRQPEPPGPGEDDEVDELVRYVRQLSAERRARRREVERTLGRDL